MIEQVASGHRDPAAVRSLINRLTIRQNGWTLGALCASYCRVVAGHHTLEDRSIFPDLRSRDAELAPVIDRLEEEHEAITDLIERVDQAMLGLVDSDPDGMAKVRAVFDLFGDALLSHLARGARARRAARAPGPSTSAPRAGPAAWTRPCGTGRCQSAGT